jgi:peptidoglycan/LPS O-acetylase OafA/YrhL
MAQGYRPQLDGLRAIAIGLVGVEHYGGTWVYKHFPSGRRRSASTYSLC